MKFLIGVSLLIIGVVAAAVLTTGFIKGDVEEESETVQTSSGISPTEGLNLDVNHAVNKEVTRNTKDIKSASNGVSLNPDKQSLDIIHNTDNLGVQVNKSNSINLTPNNNQDVSVVDIKNNIDDLDTQPTNLENLSSNSSSVEPNQLSSDTASEQKSDVLVRQNSLISDSSSNDSNLKRIQRASEAVISQGVDDLVVQDIAEVKPRSITVDISLYGNQNQSGSRVHQAINELIQQGTPLNIAIPIVIERVIEDEATSILSSPAYYSVRQFKDIALGLMGNILASNDLLTASKSLIEDNPEDIINIINVGVALYPDFAQEVINAATMTGEIDPNEALLAAIAAGADPSTVSEATAAGGVIDDFGALPFAGLGGGGSGDQEISVSNN